MFNNAKLERCWKPLELCTECDTLVILVDKQINELIKKIPANDSRMLDENSMYFKMRCSFVQRDESLQSSFSIKIKLQC